MPELNTSFVSEIENKIFSTIQINLPGGFVVRPSVLQAGLVAFLLFLLVLTLGQLRRRFMDWQMKGVLPGVGFGFALAIILEGILIVGGRTILTEVLGWKNAPKPISNVLESGREHLIEVLGINKSIPESFAFENNQEIFLKNIDSMDDSEIEKLKQFLCNEE